MGRITVNLKGTVYPNEPIMDFTEWNLYIRGEVVKSKMNKQ